MAGGSVFGGGKRDAFAGTAGYDRALGRRSDCPQNDATLEGHMTRTSNTLPSLSLLRMMFFLMDDDPFICDSEQCLR